MYDNYLPTVWQVGQSPPQPWLAVNTASTWMGPPENERAPLDATFFATFYATFCTSYYTISASLYRAESDTIFYVKII